MDQRRGICWAEPPHSAWPGVHRWKPGPLPSWTLTNLPRCWCHLFVRGWDERLRHRGRQALDGLVLLGQPTQVEINSNSSVAPVLSVCLKCRADTGVGVCSPRSVKLAEIRPRVSRPDRQWEDSVSSWRHFPGTQLRVRPIFFSLSLSQLLKPISWPWREVRWGGGLPGHTCLTVYTNSHTCT